MFSHLAEFTKKFANLSDQVQKEVVPVRSLQNASTPELTQKIFELDKSVCQSSPFIVYLQWAEPGDVAKSELTKAYFPNSKFQNSASERE